MGTIVSVLKNSIWIAGLALVLAAFSYADWQAAQRHVKLRALLNAAGFQLSLSAGLFLVSLSLLLLTSIWWEQLTWFVFGAIFAWQVWTIHREQHEK